MKHTFSEEDLNQTGGAKMVAPKGGVAVVPRRRSAGAWVAILVALVCAVGGVWWLLAPGRSGADNILENGGAGQNGLTETVAAQKVSDRDLMLYLESTAGEVRQLFEYVRQSTLVQENGQYAALMKDVGFAFDATNDLVNAVASRSVDEKGREARLITCYAGEVRFAKTIALAAAAELTGHKGSVKAMMERMTPLLCGELSLDRAAELLRECKLDRFLYDEAVLAKAKSIGAGAVVGTLAHEVGHQVLGHNYQSGKDWYNNEVRRNWEKQADLFAASVMSSSPFGEYVFAGRVFALWVGMRQTDPILKRIPARALDHPIDEERFMSLVLANKEKAAALGIVIPEVKK